MATNADWAAGYARQADADFVTFQALQRTPLPECHKLQFLQMACEKLVKAHLCGGVKVPSSLQKSHAYIAGTLPVVLREHMTRINFTGPSAKEVGKHIKHLCQEINLLAPAVTDGGIR